MNWNTIGQLAVQAVTMSTVNSVVMNAVKATMPKNTTMIQRTSFGIGGFLLAAMVSTKVAEFVNNELATIFEQPKEKTVSKKKA